MPKRPVSPDAGKIPLVAGEDPPDLSKGYLNTDRLPAESTPAKPLPSPPRVVSEYMVRDVLGQSTLEIQNYLNDLVPGGWHLSLIFGTRFIFSRHVALADALSVKVQK